MKTVPEIARVNGKWCIPGFKPSRPAYYWPDHKGRTGVVYVVECAGFYKIGLATDFEKRLKSLDLGCPLPVRRVRTRTVPLAGLAYAEAWLHEQFKDKRIKGEWFAIGREDACRLLEKARNRALLYERASATWWHTEERQAQERRRAASTAELEAFPPPA